METILGIDESGRGPVMGPLVLCGYLLDSNKKTHLKDLGVKDSKMLTAKRREALFPRLVDLAITHELIPISAQQIDKLRDSTNLNRVEIVAMQTLINNLKPDRVIIDAPEVNTQAFARKVRGGLEHECEIVAENFADKNHPEVAAASVLAKVTRDAAITQLHKKYGNFGSGYCTDPRTIGFLKDWLKKNKDFPDCVRRSWVTAQTLRTERAQTKLGSFVR